MGRTTTSRLSRFFSLLWNKNLRKDCRVIVEHVLQNDATYLLNNLNNKNLLEKLIGKKITEEHFRRYRLAIRELINIMDRHPLIPYQLLDAGDNVSNYSVLKGIFLTYTERGWHTYVSGKRERINASNAILLVPELSRVMTFETSEDIAEISRNSSVKLNQYQKAEIRNVQVYHTINKIKGVNGRETRIGTEIIVGKDLKFLFKTIADLRSIYSSELLQNMTFITTQEAGENNFQIGVFFAALGKITGSRSLAVSEGSSNLREFDFHDHTGFIKFLTDTNIIINAHKNPLYNVVQEQFQVYTKPKLTVDYSGFAFIVGYWSIDHPIPSVINIVPLGNEMDHEFVSNFYKLAYLNTRKKCRTETLRKLFPSQNFFHDSYFERNGYTYFFESGWNLEIFLKILDVAEKDNSFIPDTSHPIGQYWLVNTLSRKLYLSANPELDFASSYGLKVVFTCSKCLRECYFIGMHELRRNLVISTFLTMPFRKDHSSHKLKESIIGLKQELGNVVSSGDSNVCADFLRRYLGGNSNEVQVKRALETCKKILTLITSITHITIEGKIVSLDAVIDNAGKNHEIGIGVDFSSYSIDEFLPAFLEYVKPINITLTNLDGHESSITVGKNCPTHGIICNDTTESIISKLVSLKEREIFAEEQISKIKRVSQTAKTSFQEWFSAIDQCMFTDKRVSREQLYNISKIFDQIREHFRKEPILEDPEKIFDHSIINEISVENVMFYIFCNLVNTTKLENPEHWMSVFNQLERIRLSMHSPEAMQVGNISNKNLLLRIIAWKYLDYHYKKALGKESAYEYDDIIYNSLREQIERCTFMSGKPNSYEHLRNARFETREFWAFALLVIQGKITTVATADSFFANIPRHYPAKREKLHHTRKPNLTRNMTQRSGTTSTYRNPDLTRFSFESITRSWKELTRVKSKTHSPAWYQGKKKDFEANLTIFLTEYSKKYPQLKKLLGKDADSKIIKKFFAKMSETDTNHMNDVLAIIDSI